ncbi:BREX-2 system adenine-specific DNA-methyltransferase PglX [Corynebacterium breve]|uniref:site-specific DNA-methyltransferase (adenine-specific) n=1 Tax=Corynebacterium breve TaxID=3049799 RepID=A0ABY8VG74_9CORY|nr:BREX-2 system adenine-specific DNA-methyltransferase PglX [Corynebacterium breve]WIM67643.1 BREX-2 system adenine-specific DNA-methyltransferase PglX [Corynebacterium breve]
MVVAASDLTTHLKPVVATLVDDMRTTLHASAEDMAMFRGDFAKAQKAERVGVSFEDWEDEQLTHAAVGWVVTSVFVRFIEDNELFGPGRVFLSGYTDELRDAARFYEQQLYRAHPELSYRGYLEACFAELGKVDATAGLVDEHAAYRIYAPSEDGTKVLVEFWRTVGAQGKVISLNDEHLDTRYLGDLYENLSEFARKKYALRQTPEFVEEFILDRTLTPALQDRPLEGFKLIDPTCGSGHFLIGAFKRLFQAWRDLEPAGERRVHAKKAMRAIHGVDINPFAVAITKFRLVVQYIQALQETYIPEKMDIPFTILTGDSLLFGSDDGGNFPLDGDSGALGIAPFAYSTEDPAALNEILRSEKYDVVIGNPPYITPKDPKQNQRIRSRYKQYCKGTYALTVPFMVKFFRLAKGEDASSALGWVGQITSNSFMQREFGKPLMERFFDEVELREIIDSSGAYIPGHGTPTVILVGRNIKQTTETIRGVLGIEGEPGVPEDSEQGQVWQSIVQAIDKPGFENRFLSVKDLPSSFALQHPWSLEGGAAPELSHSIDVARKSEIGDLTNEIGRTVSSGADAYFYRPRFSFKTSRLDQHIPLVIGQGVRDYRLQSDSCTVFPYDLRTAMDVEPDPNLKQDLWTWRPVLRSRRLFGQTPEERRMRWIDLAEFYRKRFVTNLGIAFAFVATHNHFVLDRGGKVFKQSAPVIKLPEHATEDDHLELLGVLNSSVAAFWLKQNSHGKGIGGVNQESRHELFDEFFEFTGTTLKRFPLPDGNVTERARRIDTLAQELDSWEPDNLFQKEAPAQELINKAHEEYTRIRHLMIAEQEELDWAVYHLYGLTEENLAMPVGNVDGIALGQRAFEIRLARNIEASDGEKETAWFERHHSAPITEVPRSWDEGYQEVVVKRLELMESDKFIDLLERPEYKRRWASDTWDEKVTAALRDWLLDKLETPALWFRTDGMPRPRTIGELAGQVEGRVDFQGFVDVLRLWHSKRDATTLQMLTDLLKGQAVPYLKEHRYKKGGLRKRAAWERTWQQQREEDAGTRASEDVEVPPNYRSADMYPDVWAHRGKLDVPKERFIAYPGTSPADDPTLMIGWAGWNHLQQGLAIYLLFDDRLEEDAPVEVLGGILNGLQQELPWIMQWHNDIDPDMGERMGDYLTKLLHGGADRCGIAVEDLHQYVPDQKTRRRATKKKEKEK